MPTSAGPVSRLLRLTYSNSVMSSSGPEHVVQEVAQCARLLRELHQEVVLAPLVDQRPLDHLGVAADVVVAAGQHHQDGRARLDLHDVAQGSGRQRPAGSAMIPSDW
jgi:hypothetical protein